MHYYNKSSPGDEATHKVILLILLNNIYQEKRAGLLTVKKLPKSGAGKVRVTAQPEKNESSQSSVSRFEDLWPI